MGNLPTNPKANILLSEVVGNLIAQQIYDSVHRNSEQINSIEESVHRQEEKLDRILKLIEQQNI